MQFLVGLMSALLLPWLCSVCGQAEKKSQNDVFFRVSSDVILPVLTYQPDCPIEFMDASILYHVGGGGIENFQIRNRGTKPIRAYKIATVTSVGSGGKWEFEAKDKEDLLMPGQLRSLFERSIEIIPITNALRDEYKLRGPMKGITIFMVVRVECSDGSVYDGERTYNALLTFFSNNRIAPH